MSSFSHLTMLRVDSSVQSDSGRHYISLNGSPALRSSPGPNCCDRYFGIVLQFNANSTGPSPWGLESCSCGRLEHRQLSLLKLCPSLRCCCLLCLRLSYSKAPRVLCFPNGLTVSAVCTSFQKLFSVTNLVFITFAGLGLTPPPILLRNGAILPPHRHPALRKPSDRETIARAHCLGTDEFECGFHS
jgi:hypothetical protein